MPNATDTHTFNMIIIVQGSGSLAFGAARQQLAPGGGSFTAAFIYTIGSPAANAFNVTISGTGATASVSPTAPRTQRQTPDPHDSPSAMEDIPADEMQAGSVSGSVPLNSSTDIAEYEIELTMTQPSN